MANLGLNPHFSCKSAAELLALLGILRLWVKTFSGQTATAIILDLVNNPEATAIDGANFFHLCPWLVFNACAATQLTHSPW
jgi:hypothetical protein